MTTGGDTNKEAPKKPNYLDDYDDEWFDLYPERRGKKQSNFWNNFVGTFNGTDSRSRIKCEMRLYDVLQESPIVKLMLGALKSAGWYVINIDDYSEIPNRSILEIDMRRHLCCESCAPNVTGGYDPVLNQVIICQNTCTSKKRIRSTLVHEMIHMFDYCQNKFDMKNIDHVACSEIRAANIAHCSFIGTMLQGNASPFNVKRTHRHCVREKAIASVAALGTFSPEESAAAVDRVFKKCYEDLEPVGRRIRANSLDMDRAYMEGPIYGYNI